MAVTRVEKTILVMYSAEQMYGLVMDVSRYPEFLPWCSGAEILEQQECEMRATLHINFHGIRQQFTTCNRGTPHSGVVMELEQGPFQHLRGEFRFVTLAPDACRIQFVLEWKFSNFILEKMVGPVFHTIANTMVDAFVKRADERYGG